MSATDSQQRNGNFHPISWIPPTTWMSWKYILSQSLQMRAHPSLMRHMQRIQPHLPHVYPIELSHGKWILSCQDCDHLLCTNGTSIQYRKLTVESLSCECYTASLTPTVTRAQPFSDPFHWKRQGYQEQLVRQGSFLTSKAHPRWRKSLDLSLLPTTTMYMAKCRIY
jgi:hypothetical protein